MDEGRREALKAGLASAIVGIGVSGVGSAAAQAPAGGGPKPGRPGTMKIVHVFEDADGESHLAVLPVAAARKPLPVTEVLAASFAPGVEEWHRAPAKSFVINTIGDIEAETSDGTKHAIGPGDLVYVEDTRGKGHLTRLLTEGACLFMRVPDDFDVRKWASEG